MIPDIISLLVGKDISDTSKYIIQGWQSGDINMTGTLICANDIYSICSGIVIDVGKDNKNNLYSVSVEYEYAIWVRYCMLKSFDVKVGDGVAKGDKIGNAYNNILRVEYCTDEESSFPFRCGEWELYKQDPMIILSGELELPDLDDEVYIEDLDEDDTDDEEEIPEEIEPSPNYEDEENGEEG